MSPIVRRDDEYYKSGHRKKVQAIQAFIEQEDCVEEPYQRIKEFDYAVNNSKREESIIGQESDPDIGGHHNDDLNRDGTLEAVSSNHLEPLRHLSTYRSKESLRSVASNASYPPQLSHSLDIQEDFPIIKTTSPSSTIRAAASLLVQSVPSLIVSLIGLIFTGQLLDHLAVWTVFIKCDELFIAVPALQNLKGNLEMCLGAKLGTSANEGRLDTPLRRKFIITYSLLFLQYQALAVSALAGVLSFFLGYAMKHRVASPEAAPGDEDITEGYTKPGFSQLMLILSAGMLTAGLSSLVLGNFMSWLVVVCRWFGIDPDNIASPLAACLGDFLTLFILALVGSALVYGLSTPIPFVATLIMVVTTLAVRWYCRLPKHSHGSKRVKETEEEEEGAWWPLIAAMLISCGTGVVLESSVSKYNGFALLGVTMTGISGSIGAIYASRLSTELHADKHAREGHIVDQAVQSAPRLSNFGSGVTLFIAAWPVQAFFLAFLALTGWTQIAIGLLVWFLTVYTITTAVSVMAAHAITMYFWNRGLDPDSYTLPIHSALIDLFGQLLLVAAYELASAGGTQVKTQS